jgi:predicted P-loop ATPase
MPDFAKDSVLEAHGVWIMELAELAGIRGAASEKVKSFLSRQSDHIRLPYGRRIEERKRAFVFCGSTNSDTPFTDETGNRRYWPVKCGVIDIEKLKADRDQLWAEAVARYKKGEHWWPDAEMEKLAEKEQSKRYQPGQWDAEIIEWLKNPTQQSEELWSEDKKGIKSCTMKPVEPFNSSKEFVTVRDILMHAIGKPKDRWVDSDVKAITRCLKSNHWEPGRKRVSKKGDSWVAT